MFDKFKEEKGGEMMEERIEENVNEEELVDVSPNSESTIGIGELMGKRAKLEEAIDYVGLMIKNLKDKRTMLEKDCLLYTSPSPRDKRQSRMPSSA